MRFLDIFYNILFHPAQEFKVVAIGPVPKDLLLAYSAIIVIVVSAIGVVYTPMASATTEGITFHMLLAGFSGIVFWVVSGSIFALTSYIFCQRGRPMTLLILTGYATLPWLFLPVTMLFKDVLGSIGNTIAIMGALGLWLWTTVLYLMALKYTYSLSLERVFLAASLPLLMSFLGVSWVGGFFFNLIQFFS